MKKSIRILAALIAALFLITGMAMIVYAADVVPGDGGAGAGGAGAGDAGSGDAGAGDAGSGDAGSGDAGSGDAGSGDAGSGDSGSGDAGSGDAGSGDYSGGDSGDYSGGDSGDYSGGDNYIEDPYQYYDDSPISYGGNYNSGDEIDAGSVADSTKLYDTTTINDSDLAANTWSEIVLNDSGASKSGGGDFSTIQQNTETEDNSQWMLYVGIALIVLSLLGILYFIIATAAQRKQAKREAERMRQHERIHNGSTPPRPRSDSHRYSDGYEAAPRRRSSKHDTAEVYTPRRAR